MNFENENKFLKEEVESLKRDQTNQTLLVLATSIMAFTTLSSMFKDNALFVPIGTALTCVSMFLVILIFLVYRRYMS